MDISDNTFTLIVKGHKFEDVQLEIRELSPQLSDIIGIMEEEDQDFVNLDKMDLEVETMEFILNHLKKVNYKP